MAVAGRDTVWHLWGIGARSVSSRSVLAVGSAWLALWLVYVLVIRNCPRVQTAPKSWARNAHLVDKDPTRRAILKLLRSRDLTAGEIAERFPLAKSTLSGHFTVLKQAGLIVAERHGTTIVYSANVSAIEEALGVVMGLLGSRTRRRNA